MKRKMCVITWILALLVLTACGNSGQPAQGTTVATTEKTSLSVLEQALAYVEKGEYEQAHGLLYALTEPSEEEQELLSRFTYQCVEKTASDGGKRVWTYNDQGLVLTDYLTNADGSWEKTETTYDDQGNVFSEKIEDSDGLSLEYVYAYDENGRKLGEMLNSSTMTYYIYDDAGKLVSEEDLYHNTTATYTYDDNGNLIKHRSDFGEIWAEYTYTYDDRGNQLTSKMQDEQERWYQYTYTYDDDGNKITEDYERSTGAFYHQEYTYDEKGNVLTMKRTTANGWQELTYTYDEHGNNIAVKSVNSKGVTVDYTCAYQIFYTQ